MTKGEECVIFKTYMENTKCKSELILYMRLMPKACWVLGRFFCCLSCVACHRFLGILHIEALEMFH